MQSSHLKELRFRVILRAQDARNQLANVVDIARRMIKPDTDAGEWYSNPSELPMAMGEMFGNLRALDEATYVFQLVGGDLGPNFADPFPSMLPLSGDLPGNSKNLPMSLPTREHSRTVAEWILLFAEAYAWVARCQTYPPDFPSRWHTDGAPKPPTVSVLGQGLQVLDRLLADPLPIADPILVSTKWASYANRRRNPRAVLVTAGKLVKPMALAPLKDLYRLVDAGREKVRLFDAQNDPPARKNCACKLRSELNTLGEPGRAVAEHLETLGNGWFRLMVSPMAVQFAENWLAIVDAGVLNQEMETKK